MAVLARPRRLVEATTDDDGLPLPLAQQVPLVSLHGLRHTGASLALARGVPLIVVSKQLGHGRIKTTSDAYAHIVEDAQLDAFTAGFGAAGVRGGVREANETRRLIWLNHAAWRRRGRVSGSQKVRGSIPLGSTLESPAPVGLSHLPARRDQARPMLRCEYRRDVGRRDLSNGLCTCVGAHPRLRRERRGTRSVTRVG